VCQGSCLKIGSLLVAERTHRLFFLGGRSSGVLLCTANGHVILASLAQEASRTLKFELYQSGGVMSGSRPGSPPEDRKEGVLADTGKHPGVELATSLENTKDRPAAPDDGDCILQLFMR
jgi:hypothetical protein